ncbi:hypothetical protein, partial [Spiroplasma sp. hyd1]|uniref:hypothetical protein n=1 Tax=Spiroplasma sp. hyd1 TaxID=1609976 RepID=UPI0018DB8EB5
EASPDINRQVPKKGVNLSSLKAVTVPTVLYSEFKINLNDLSYIDLGEFWININKLKDHLLEVKSNIPSLIFAGKVDNKVYDSVLFNKYKGKEKVYGNLTIGLKANYRTERVINFGKKTAKRKENDATKEELEFQRFVFLGFFGGGKSIENQKMNKNLNFVELIIDKKSKEIYHKINYEKLEYFKKEMSIGPTLKTFPNILEVNEEEQNKILYDNWDTNIFELNKNENLEVITINRQSCLSLEHNRIQSILAAHFFNQDYKVKIEKFNFIDLYVENENETKIFEIKTSGTEIYKAIGQILVYENFVLSNNLQKSKFEKIILFDKIYSYDSKILLTLKKYNIELKVISDYI